MLGLGGSLTAGVPESKYSANFNGTDGYITIDGLSSSLADHMAFSLSIWFKGGSNDSDGNHKNILFSAHQGNKNNVFRIGLDAAGAAGDQGIFYSDTVTGDHGGIGGVDLDDGAWHNVIVTRPAGAGNQQAKIYIDGGSAITTDLDDCDPSWTNVELVSIGQEWDDPDDSDWYEGKINDVAFWNVELDDASRLKVYNLGKPFNLKVDSGGYDNSSDLIGYWRMGNGFFDDKANGIVHDQNNPGFGSDLFDSGKGTFDSGTGSWVKYHTNTITNVDNQLVITYNGAGGTLGGDEAYGAYLYFRDGFDLSRELTLDKVYVIEFDAKYAGGGGNSKIVVANSADETAVLTTTMKKYRLYSRANGFSGDESNMYIRLKLMDAGTVVTIDNLSIRELNGNPGITFSGVTFSSDTP